MDCIGPWSPKESDTTELYHFTSLYLTVHTCLNIHLNRDPFLVKNKKKVLNDVNCVNR